MTEVLGYNIPTWICVVTPTLIALYKYLTWNFGYFKERGIPHPKPIPLMGNLAPIFKKGIVKFDEDIRKEYGKVVGIFDGRKPSYLIYDLDILKEILVKEFSHFQNHQNAGLNTYPLRKIITQLEFDHWKHVRTILTPTFSGVKLRRMNAAVNKCCRVLLTHLEKKVEDSETMDMKTLWSNFTMDVIASSAFGIEIDCAAGDEEFAKMGRRISNNFESGLDPKILILNGGEKSSESAFARLRARRNGHWKSKQFLEVAKSILANLRIIFVLQVKNLLITGPAGSQIEQIACLEAIFCPWVMKYFKISFFPKGTVEFFVDVVNQSLKNRGSDEKSANDFLQLMVNCHIDDPKESDFSKDPNLKKSNQGFLYSSKGLTHEEILAQSFIFFLAGFDTTGGTLSFLSYNLACNPEKQEKVYEEITQVMEGKTEPDYDLIKKMPYLQMCIEESLRMFPVATRSDRMCNEDVVINGVKFEKGMNVGIPIWSIHHDPDIWPDPHNFIPERFTPEEKASRHPMAWQPFGQGPRNCVGIRLALMIIKFAMIPLLLNFRLVPCEETQIPLVMHRLKIDGEKGIKIKMEKR